MSTTYLEVPKVLPYRKPRTRSKTRIRGADATAHLFTSKNSTPPRPSWSAAKTASTATSSVSNEAVVQDYPSCSETSRHQCHHCCHPLEPTEAKLSTSTTSNPNNELHTMTRDSSPGSGAVNTPLRKRLEGTWRLESYRAYPLPTSPDQRPSCPMTNKVTGLIMYTSDGYMSAQMLVPGQQPFKRGEDKQWAEAGKRSFAYSGPYYISNEGVEGREEILRHTFEQCNLPGWIGDIQIRTWRFEDEGQVLVLSSEEPTDIKGEFRVPVLRWRRAVDNTNAEPPPPVPQIKVSGPGEP